MLRTALLPIVVLSACSTAPGQHPSLQPRAAEALDPRVPVVRPMNGRPVSPTLASRLSELVDQAQTGDVAFGAAVSKAERLAAAAGAPRSEGWIAAEESLTAAIAARKPTAAALGDLDEIGARALQTQRGIAPNDLAAIERAAATIGSLDRQQAARVHAIQERLGL